MITLKVRTPEGRDIYTGGNHSKSFYVSPCDIYVFAGDVLLETLDAAGKVDYRAELTAVEGNSPVNVDLQKVPVTPAALQPQARPQPKTGPRAAPKKKPRGGRGDR